MSLNVEETWMPSIHGYAFSWIRKYSRTSELLQMTLGVKGGHATYVENYTDGLGQITDQERWNCLSEKMFQVMKHVIFKYLERRLSRSDGPSQIWQLCRLPPGRLVQCRIPLTWDKIYFPEVSRWAPGQVHWLFRSQYRSRLEVSKINTFERRWQVHNWSTRDHLSVDL